MNLFETKEWIGTTRLSEPSLDKSSTFSFSYKPRGTCGLAEHLIKNQDFFNYSQMLFTVNQARLTTCKTEKLD